MHFFIFVDSSGLSAGGIVGVVIVLIVTCILLLLLLIMITFLIIVRLKSQRKPNGTSMAMQYLKFLVMTSVHIYLIIILPICVFLST